MVSLCNSTNLSMETTTEANLFKARKGSKSTVTQPMNHTRDEPLCSLCGTLYEI